MNLDNQTDKRYMRLDELTEELTRAIDAYNLHAVLPKEIGQASDVEASKKILDIAQEIHIIERELESLIEFELGEEV